MAHCATEEAAVALAEIDLTEATEEQEVAESVLVAAEADLEECEDEHGT